jgi:hypothetical protein
MVHLIDRHSLARAESTVLLSVFWAALGACAIGAAIYDIATWLAG